MKSAANTQNNFILKAMPLFLVLFIDSLGMAFMTPLISPLFLSRHSVLFLSTTSLSMRNFYYGLTLAIFPIVAFFGAPILGGLSDSVGRKKVLTICLLGTFLGYLFSAFAILFHHIFLLLLGRVIDGFTAGSITIAQAAIVDLSTKEKKAAHIGLILFAASLGLLAGPLLSSFFINVKIAAWFTLSTPFYVAAILSFLNLFLLWLFFHETFFPNQKKHVHWLQGLQSFVAAFKERKIRGISIVFLCYQLGWALFIQFIALFLIYQYRFSPNDLGVYMALVGVGMAIAFCYLVGLFSKLFSLNKITLFSILFMAILVLAALIIHSAILTWLIPILIAIVFGFAYSAQISIFSNQVDATKQGWIMGLTGAISFFAFGVSGLVAGVLADVSSALPLWLGLAMLIAGVLFATTAISSKCLKSQ